MTGHCSCVYVGAADPRDHHPRCAWVVWLKREGLFIAQVLGLR